MATSNARDRALAQPVVGHVANAAALALGDAEPRDVLLAEQHAAAIGPALAGDDLRELALAVAVDAGDRR